MSGLSKRVQDIVVSAAHDINNLSQRELLDSAFEQYAETLREPLNIYRDHSNQTLPNVEALQERFQYETAVLHVISRALAFDVGLSNSAVIAHLPIHRRDNLYSWYSLPDQLCHEIDAIAADVLDWRFFRQFISDLSVDIQNIARSHGLGEYYTPFPIVRHLIEISGLTAKCITEGKRTIDPACGSGIILLTIAQLVIDYCLDGHCDAFTALSSLSQNLYGFDVQPFAISLTKSLLIHASSRILGECVFPEPLFPNIRVVDTLATSDDYWYGDGYFHYVIGNPPFVSVKKQHLTCAEKYSEILYGHPNLYQLFLWWAVKSTIPGGKVSFLLPQSVLIGTYTKQLRLRLSESTTLTAITRMIDRYRVVADTDQQMMVVCLQVRPQEIPDDGVAIRVTRNGNDIHNTKPQFISRNRIIQNVAGSTIWVVSDRRLDYAILDRLEARASMVSDMCKSIKVGNGSFVWNQNKALLSESREESSIPLISSAAIDPYVASFPYRGRHSTHSRQFARVTAKVESKRHFGPVLLIQRTTPRKTGRRIVAGMLPGEFHVQYSTYFLENHVNYIHALEQDSQALLYALNIWLNSEIINFAFQLRNGTAHISVFELQTLPVIIELLKSMSQQALKLMQVPGELQHDTINNLNAHIFDWIDLGPRHRQRIARVLSQHERNGNY